MAETKGGEPVVAGDMQGFEEHYGEHYTSLLTTYQEAMDSNGYDGILIYLR